MRATTARRLSAVFLAAAVLFAACSGDDDGSPPDTAPSVATDPPDTADPTTTAAPVVTSAPATTQAPDPEPEPTPTDPLEVVTDLGTVIGTDSGVEGIRAFLTIPFASPPVDELRWRPPQPHPGWTEPLAATEPGASCPQSGEGATAAFTIIPDWDEDCLTLSVWSPEDADGLPVMVWIHGGGLTTGSAHQPYYIGDHLADEGVVVVNVNYRLGVFGFLATDELADEGGDTGFGNYGLADQTLALDWVQRNIDAFGGDPGNVTIFGESAGGFSVCGHLASTASAGLFHRAIIMSGGGCARTASAERALATGATLAEAVGCADLDCLRSLSAEELLAAPFSPALVLDEVVLSEHALDIAARGDLDHVDVLIGSNADESTLFTFGWEELTEAELIERVAMFSENVDELLSLYSADAFDTNLDRYRAISTDASFTCPALRFAEARTATYVYHYTYVSPTNPFGLGATHGAELALLFSHPEGIRGLDIEPDDVTSEVAAEIRAAWASFAADGVPRGDWPSYGTDGQLMVLDAPFQLVDEIRDGRCAEFDPPLR